MINQCSLQKIQTEECPYRNQCHVPSAILIILAELGKSCYINGQCFFSRADKLLKNRLKNKNVDYSDLIFRPGRENEIMAMDLTVFVADHYHEIAA